MRVRAEREPRKQKRERDGCDDWNDKTKEEN